MRSRVPPVPPAERSSSQGSPPPSPPSFSPPVSPPPSPPVSPRVERGAARFDSSVTGAGTDADAPIEPEAQPGSRGPNSVRQSAIITPVATASARAESDGGRASGGTPSGAAVGAAIDAAADAAPTPPHKRGGRWRPKRPQWRQKKSAVVKVGYESDEEARGRQAQAGGRGKLAVGDESMDGPEPELTTAEKVRIAVGWFFQLALFFVFGAIALAYGIDMNDNLAITTIVVWVVSARARRCRAARSAALAAWRLDAVPLLTPLPPPLCPPPFASFRPRFTARQRVHAAGRGAHPDHALRHGLARHRSHAQDRDSWPPAQRPRSITHAIAQRCIHATQEPKLS